MKYLLDISIFCLGLLVMYGAMTLDMRADRQPNQVNIPLYAVVEIQKELKDRGHDIKIDGKFGGNTDHALTVEITKGR